MGTEMKKCPRCGRDVRVDEYFCNYCGEALFPDTSSAGIEYSPDSSQGRAASVDMGGRNPGLSPYGSEASSGYRMQDTPPPGKPVTRPSGGKRIPWGTIVAAAVIAAIVATGLFLYFVLKAPGMKVSPPPGWVEVSAEEKDAKEQGLQEDSPDEDLITMYKREGSPGGIVITRRGAEEDGEIPETSEVAVMEQHIEEMGRWLNPEEIGYLEDIDAVMLGCGLAAQYQVTEGGEWNYEVLIVRRKDKVFTILYFTKNPMLQIPSPEMQYFIDTISFN